MYRGKRFNFGLGNIEELEHWLSAGPFSTPYAAVRSYRRLEVSKTPENKIQLQFFVRNTASRQERLVNEVTAASFSEALDLAFTKRRAYRRFKELENAPSPEQQFETASEDAFSELNTELIAEVMAECGDFVENRTETSELVIFKDLEMKLIHDYVDRCKRVAKLTIVPLE